MSGFSDGELLAFLDGTLSEERSADVITALSGDPALELRLMALDDVAPMVRDTFEAVCEDRVAQVVLPSPDATTATARPWRPMLMAASLAAGIAVLGTLAALGPRDAEAGWMDQVAAYQALYSRETIAGVGSPQADLIDQLARAEEALNIVLPKQELLQIAGLELRRAQMLAFEGQPLVQIVFADSAGQPIALCILMTGDAPPEGTLDLAQLHGLQSAAFSDDGFGFIVIGPTDAAAISTYADTIKTALAQG